MEVIFSHLTVRVKHRHFGRRLPSPSCVCRQLRGMFHRSQHTAHLSARRRGRREQGLPTPGSWASFLGSVSRACEKAVPGLPGIPVGNEEVIWYGINNEQRINAHLPLDTEPCAQSWNRRGQSATAPETGRWGHLQKTAGAWGGFLQPAVDSPDCGAFVKTIKAPPNQSPRERRFSGGPESPGPALAPAPA